MEALKANINAITGREKFTHRDTDTWREMPHDKRERETGMMPLHIEEHQGLQATTRNLEEMRKHPPLEPSEGAWPC